MNNVYLSICIPTNGRIEILKNTLDSIFVNCEVNYSDFEVILSDNSNNQDLLDLLKEYKKYPNIVYDKTTCEGFLNSVNALKLGNGQFLKLHNNYTMLDKGCLTKMIAFIKREAEMKPLVFFSNGAFNSFNEKVYHSYDRFMYDLSFWSTWSTGFSIWKQDFELYSEHELHNMFPQTSLILFQNSKNYLIINDSLLFVNQEVPKKGGYNLFKTFGVDYLKLIDSATNQGYVTLSTFKKIKRDLYYKFLVVWYYNTKIAKNDYTYDTVDIKNSISFYYSNLNYYKLIVLAYIFSLKKTVVSLLRS